VCLADDELDSARAFAMVDAHSDPSFVSAITASFSVIMVTELGDKTFFIAAILAMRNSRLSIYSGAMLALIVMTLLAVCMGQVAPLLLPKVYTHYAAAFLFLFFGVRLLRDAAGMDANHVSDELEEVEAELGGGDGDSELEPLQGGGRRESSRAKSTCGLPVAFVQSFTLTFLAEWGDRSQIATLALAASKNPMGVTVGSIVGHGVCTGLAVLGGRMLASRISERTVLFVGGLVFLAFALAAFFMGPEDL
jgi:putative Ca2+/H+ antiporter (TMEM165/GDT1 family)